MNNKSTIINDSEIINNNVIDIRDFLNILERRRKAILLTSAIVFTLSIISLSYRRITNPQYLGTFSIMTRDPILDKKRGSSGSAIIEDLAVNQTYSDMPTLIQYLKSEKVISKTAISNNIPANALSKQINISVPRNPDVQNFMPSILKIDVIGPDKIKLLKIIKDLSDDYIKIASDTKEEKLIDGLKFLNNERPSLEKRSIKLQNQLEEFRLVNKLINPLNEAELITTRIEEIKNKILILESENVRLLFIKDNLLNGILYTEGINNQNESSGLEIMGAEQLLLQEILDVKAALAKAQSTYKKTSKYVLNLEAKLNQLEPILLENQKSAVDAAIVINKGKIKSSQNELTELDKQFSNLPKLINEYSRIISNQKLIDQNLEYLLSATEKLELELSQGTLPWKIISKPYISPRPFKPEIEINLLYGLLASLFIGVIIGLISDKVDNVFHSSNELQKDNRIPPLLGFIPFFKFTSVNNEIDNEGKDTLTVNNFNKIPDEDASLNFIYQETFRNIYTSIKFSKIDKNIKTIAITSSIPSEGKSLFSILLALNVSEIDKKVLIVDVDLRKPSLHKKLEVDNIAGLSNILVDDKYNWKDALNQIGNYKNLSFITGGKTPPNPIKLLNSKKMRSLVEDFSNEFDLIIFDCPPLIGLSDALILSEFVDGVILTVSLNKVKKQLVKDSLEKLETASNEILGIVTNTIKQPNNLLSSKNTYYYNYQYTYENSYLPLDKKNLGKKNKSENDELSDNNSGETFLNKSTKNFIKIKNKFINWLNE